VSRRGNLRGRRNVAAEIGNFDVVRRASEPRHLWPLEDREFVGTRRRRVRRERRAGAAHARAIASAMIRARLLRARAGLLHRALLPVASTGAAAARGADARELGRDRGDSGKHDGREHCRGAAGPHADHCVQPQPPPGASPGSPPAVRLSTTRCRCSPESPSSPTPSAIAGVASLARSHGLTRTHALESATTMTRSSFTMMTVLKGYGPDQATGVLNFFACPG
jgi:hypothetical protein